MIHNIKKPITFADCLGTNQNALWFDPVMQATQASAMNTLGLKWVRSAVYWDRLETSKGVFDWALTDAAISVAESHGLKVLFYLVGSPSWASSAPPSVTVGRDQYPPTDYDDYAETLAICANRYPNVTWQIWNEQNSPDKWHNPNATDYAAFASTALTKMRADASHATVILGGMQYFSEMPGSANPMLIDMANAGHLDGYDAICYHPYTNIPEGQTVGDNYFLETCGLANGVIRGDTSAPIWLTEYGFSDYDGTVEAQPLISDVEQASYILRSTFLAMCTEADKAIIFALSDLDSRATPRDRKYGLLLVDGTPKPAGMALFRTLAFLGASVSPARWPTRLSTLAMPGRVVKMKRADGLTVLAAWSDTPQNLKITHPSATINNPVDGTQVVKHASGGKITVALTSKPVLIALW